MTDTQKKKLSVVFNALTDEEKNRDLLNLPYERFENILNNKEDITVEISDEIRNRSMFMGYFGKINLLRISKGELILKPKLIKELLY